MDPGVPQPPVFGMANPTGGAGLKKSSSFIDLDEIFKEFLASPPGHEFDDGDMEEYDGENITGVFDSDSGYGGASPSPALIIDDKNDSIPAPPAGNSILIDRSQPQASPQAVPSPAQAQAIIANSAARPGAFGISPKNQAMIAANLARGPAVSRQMASAPPAPPPPAAAGVRTTGGGSGGGGPRGLPPPPAAAGVRTTGGGSGGGGPRGLPPPPLPPVPPGLGGAAAPMMPAGVPARGLPARGLPPRGAVPAGGRLAQNMKFGHAAAQQQSAAQMNYPHGAPPAAAARGLPAASMRGPPPGVPPPRGPVAGMGGPRGPLLGGPGAGAGPGPGPGPASGDYSRPLMPMVRDAAARPPRTISARVGFIKEDPEPAPPPAKKAKGGGRRGGRGGGGDSEDEDEDEDGEGLGGPGGEDAGRVQRRERNREHAKRSRLRKKFLLDALQQSVLAMEHENKRLRDEIGRELGQEGHQLLRALPPAVTAPRSLIAREGGGGGPGGEGGGAAGAGAPPQRLDNPDYALVKALQTAQQNFVITDPLLPDNPIVFASAGFLTLTGYSLDQVLGRNCRFLQGPETDPRAIDKIRQAVTCGYDSSVCLLNYRRDGSAFWNQFFIAALRDGDGQIVNYVGVQCMVSEVYAQEVIAGQYSDDEGAGPSSSGGGGGGRKG